MQNLTDRHGYPTIERALRFLSMQLRARPETEGMAAEVDTLRDRTREVEEAWQDASTRRVVATANIKYHDELLDAVVADLARDVLAAVGGDRDHKTYKLLFPTAPSLAMKPVATEPQAIYVQALLATLQTPDYADWADRVGPISARLEALAAQQKARSALYAAEAQASAARQVNFDEVRRAYNLMYPRLLVQHPDDKRRVESLFAAL